MMSIVLLTCCADSHRSHSHKIPSAVMPYNADTALLHAFTVATSPFRVTVAVCGSDECTLIALSLAPSGFTVKVSVVVAPTFTLADAGDTVSPVTLTVSVPSSARYGRPHTADFHCAGHHVF